MTLPSRVVEIGPVREPRAIGISGTATDDGDLVWVGVIWTGRHGDIASDEELTETETEI